MAAIDRVLRAVSPGASRAFVAASANAAAIMAEFNITAPNAQAQLIGHMAVECAGFKSFEENLSYSAQRLTQVWPKRFPSLAAAQPYAHNPKALALKVYAGRMGNRPNTDDAWDDRGSGGLQHTGHAEFARVERRTSLPVLSHPEMLRDATRADAIWRAACSYFVDRGVLAAASAGDTTAVCIKINGGTTGLSDRKIMVTRAMHALGGTTIVVAEKTTHEQADDAKRSAKAVTQSAPVGLVGSSGGSAADGFDWGVAIAIGVGVLLTLGVLAAVMWRRHDAKRSTVEAMHLQKLEERLNLDSAPPAAA